jgi:hypothetical protein
MHDPISGDLANGLRTKTRVSVSSLTTAIWLLLLTIPVMAFDWEAAKKNLGVVEGKDRIPILIAKGNIATGRVATGGENWLEVPTRVAEWKTSMLVADDKHAGVTIFRVIKSGWIFFAAIPGTEGSAGPWLNERKDEGQLKQDGWTELSNADTGGPLITEKGRREWKIFAKVMAAGTSGILRTNKYVAPGFFSFPSAGLATNGATVTPVPWPAYTPSTTPAEVSIPTAVVDPVTAAASSDLVRKNRNNLVFIQGKDGAGSGFIAKFKDGNYLVTNAHVAAGVRSPTYKTLDGQQVAIGAAACAVGHDIFRTAVASGGSPLEIMDHVGENASINDDVVVLGNSEGAGVVNTINGKIVGIGPNLVEVDAPFQPGNSGSPIIHLKTGKVIGVATYHTVRKYDNATKEAIKKPIVRRFGYRIDSVTTWQPVNWQPFYAQATEMESIEELTVDLGAFLQDLGKNSRVTRGAHTNPAIKNRIDAWQEARSKRLSPRDVAIANQSMLSFLKITCQSDVAAARQRMTYDYFQRGLADQQRERTEIASVFGQIIENIRQER